MFIEITRPCAVNGEHRIVGETMEVSEVDAYRLMGMSKAKLPEPEPAPAPEPPAPPEPPALPAPEAIQVQDPTPANRDPKPSKK